MQGKKEPVRCAQDALRAGTGGSQLVDEPFSPRAIRTMNMEGNPQSSPGPSGQLHRYLQAALLSELVSDIVSLPRLIFICEDFPDI